MLSCVELVAPCKRIQDGLGFLIPRRGFRIPGTLFQCLSVGFWIPIVSGIPDSTTIIFPDSGIRIPLHGAILVSSAHHQKLDFRSFIIITICK